MILGSSFRDSLFWSRSRRKRKKKYICVYVYIHIEIRCDEVRLLKSRICCTAGYPWCLRIIRIFYRACNTQVDHLGRIAENRADSPRSLGDTRNQRISIGWFEDRSFVSRCGLAERINRDFVFESSIRFASFELTSSHFDCIRACTQSLTKDWPDIAYK